MTRNNCVLFVPSAAEPSFITEAYNKNNLLEPELKITINVYIMDHKFIAPLMVI